MLPPTCVDAWMNHSRPKPGSRRSDVAGPAVIAPLCGGQAGSGGTRPPAGTSGGEHREDVARGVLEPGDGVAGLAGDAPLVLTEVRISLEDDPRGDELVDGRFDVVDREVQHRERRRLVVRLRVDDPAAATREADAEQAVVLGHVEAEGLAVEPFRGRNVVRR